MKLVRTRPIQVYKVYKMYKVARFTCLDTLVYTLVSLIYIINFVQLVRHDNVEKYPVECFFPFYLICRSCL